MESQSPESQFTPDSAAAIPDHQLIRLIGKGSYGEVWLARNALGAYRAVKIVFERHFRNKRPFDREFNGVQKFEPVSRLHDGLMDILQVGRNDAAGYFYCVMELADDIKTGQNIDPENYCPRTLAQELLRLKKLPVKECRTIGTVIASALDFLHRRGLIHRDIKPSNIVFVNGVPKLADIGLVAEVSEARSYVGTEGFIPPEGPGTAQADLYSLGKVLYEISTGKDRHEYPELPTEMGEPAEQRDLLEFSKIFVRACRANAVERYVTAQAVMADLEALQRGERLKPHKVRRQPARGALFKVLAFAMIAGLAGVVLVMFPRMRSARADSNSAAEPAAVPAGIVGWWQAEQNAFDFLGQNNGKLVNGAGFAPGKIGRAFSFNGERQYIQISNSPALTLTNGLTIEAWVNVRGFPVPPKQEAIIFGKTSSYTDIQYVISLMWLGTQWGFRPLLGTSQGTLGFEGQTVVKLNTWYHVALSCDRKEFKLYVNGKLEGIRPAIGFLFDTEAPLLIGGGQLDYYFNGLVDELTVYNRALTEREIGGIWSAGSSGKRLSPPRITRQPADCNVSAGDRCLFTVEQESGAPAAYQWMLNGNLIAGATNASFLIDRVQATDAGHYTVVVSNPGGSARSSNAWLQITPVFSFTNCSFAPGELFQYSSRPGGSTFLETSLVLKPPPKQSHALTWLNQRYCANGFSTKFQFRLAPGNSGSSPPGGTVCWHMQDAPFKESADHSYHFSSNSLQVALSFSTGQTPGLQDCTLEILSPATRGNPFAWRGTLPVQNKEATHQMEIRCDDCYLNVAADGRHLLTNYIVPFSRALNAAGCAVAGIEFQSRGEGDQCEISGWSFCTETKPRPAALPSGLVGWWRGEGDAREACTGKIGTLTGVEFQPGKVGQAFSFNGTNSFIEVADYPALRLTNELTIEFWVSRQRFDESLEFCIEKGGDWTRKGQNYGVTLNRESFNFCLGFHFAGGWRGAGTVADTRWHHCAIVARNGNIDPVFYIDGVAQPVTIRGGAERIYLYPSTRPLHIGAQVNSPEGWTYFGKVLLDEVCLYNRALTAQEIAAVFAAGRMGKTGFAPGRDF